MEEHEEIVDSSDLKIQEIRGFVGKIFGMVEDKKPRRDETLLARGGSAPDYIEYNSKSPVRATYKHSVVVWSIEKREKIRGFVAKSERKSARSVN